MHSSGWMSGGATTVALGPLPSRKRPKDAWVVRHPGRAEGCPWDAPRRSASQPGANI